MLFFSFFCVVAHAFCILKDVIVLQKWCTNNKPSKNRHPTINWTIAHMLKHNIASFVKKSCDSTSNKPGAYINMLLLVLTANEQHARQIKQKVFKIKLTCVCIAIKIVISSIAWLALASKTHTQHFYFVFVDFSLSQCRQDHSTWKSRRTKNTSP